MKLVDKLAKKHTACASSYPLRLSSTTANTQMTLFVCLMLKIRYCVNKVHYI